MDRDFSDQLDSILPDPAIEFDDQTPVWTQINLNLPGPARGGGQAQERLIRARSI